MCMLEHARISWHIPSPVLQKPSRPGIKAQDSFWFSEPSPVSSPGLSSRTQNPGLSLVLKTIFLKTILTSRRVSGPVHRENQLVHCKQRFTTRITWPVHMPGIIYYI